MTAVSVIVPTIGRPSLRSAVLSLVAQKNCDVEIIVVLDDPSKRSTVERLLHDVPYVLAITNGLGAAGARNRGLGMATADYVGYLDDDDVWLEDKAWKQIRAIRGSRDPSMTFSVVASTFVRADNTKVKQLPRTFDRPKDDFADFLVERRTIRYGSVYFNTPALLGPHSLMTRVIWDPTLRKHQDWDLMIRLFEADDVGICVVNEHLVQVNQGSVDSISMLSDWRHGERFLRKHDDKITGRARADFVIVHMLLHALREFSWRGVKASLKETRGAIPHIGAFVRFAAGLVLRR